jgi:hypothetical protein
MAAQLGMTLVKEVNRKPRNRVSSSSGANTPEQGMVAVEGGGSESSFQLRQQYARVDHHRDRRLANIVM